MVGCLGRFAGGVAQAFCSLLKLARFGVSLGFFRTCRGLIGIIAGPIRQLRIAFQLLRLFACRVSQLLQLFQ